MNSVFTKSSKIKIDNNSYKLKDLLIIFFISLLISFIYINQASNWFGIFINFQPSLDMTAYYNNAIGIISGIWPGTKPFFRAPLYSYILAGMIIAGKNLFNVIFIQAVFFSFSTCIVYLAGTALFNRVSGLISAFILIFYGGAFYWIIVLHSTVFELFLSSLTFFFIIRLSFYFKNKENNFIKIILYSFAAAISFALLCLIRTNFLIIAPFIGIGFFIESYKSKQIKHFIVSLLIVSITCISFWSPFALHNKKYSNSFLTSNAGPTWSFANTEGSGVFNAMTPYGNELSVKSLAFWKHLLKKMAAFGSNCEYPQNVNFYLFKNYIPILKFLFIPFGIILALFIFGLFLNFDKFAKIWPCYAFFFPFYISVSVFFIIGRFRIPALPPILIMSGFSVYFLSKLMAEKKVLYFLISVISIFMLYILSNPFYKPIPNYSYKGLASAALYTGNYNEAVKVLEQIKTLDLSSADMLIAAYYLNNQIKDAVKLLDIIQNKTKKNLNIEKKFILGSSNINIKDDELYKYPILFYIFTVKKINQTNKSLTVFTNL